MLKRRESIRLGWAPLLICFASAPARGVDKNSSGREFFENKIRPVLAERCLSCHTGELAQAGLRLDYRGGWEKGGKLGPAIVQDDPDKSPLIRAIRHEPLAKDDRPDELLYGPP